MNMYTVHVRASLDDSFDVEATDHADAEKKGIREFHECHGFYSAHVLWAEPELIEEGIYNE